MNIYLADLRHNYLGYFSSDAMPLGIGYMKAVMDHRLPYHTSRLFAYPDKLEAAIDDVAPDVLMLTNYTWNEALSMSFAEYARQKNPDCLVVVGGPNIPIENERRIAFLQSHPYVDLYALGEGDFFATELVSRYIECGLDRQELFSQEIHSSAYRRNGEYSCTEIKPRSKNLDDIPSPWLTGILDEFFDGKLVPLLETNRGCPFSCAFCVQGTKWYQKVNEFCLERLEKEIHYIARKISTDFPQQKVLRIADPNFGMFNRDVDIAGYLGETQVKYNYPLLIDATTGKNRADNIIKTMEKVNGALVLYQAVQSLDEEVLENIQRSNIKLEAYEELQVYIKGRGMKSSSDLILGLPGESLKKHLSSLEKLINAKTDKLNNFQAMLLKGSNLETVATRSKYDFKTMFRLLPKSYGNYAGRMVFDTEEIVVANKDMSFDDYLTARKHHLVINIFWNFTRFEGFIKVAESYGYTPWQWLESIVKTVNDSNLLSEVYDGFLSETRSELFGSEEELQEFYSDKTNFEKLNRGELGDNLIYKYRTLALFYYWNEVVETAFESTLNLLKNNEVDPQLSGLLNQYRKYVRFVYVSGKSPEQILKDHLERFDFDMEHWIRDNYSVSSVAHYKLPHPRTVSFQLSLSNRSNLEDTFKIWSFDPRSFSMFIRRIHNDWLKREVKDANTCEV
ncbi:MAG: hypothetical protein RL266_2863 [Bacteroidota bacterium]